MEGYSYSTLRVAGADSFGVGATLVVTLALAVALLKTSREAQSIQVDLKTILACRC
jgi:hypothetical protein